MSDTSAPARAQEESARTRTVESSVRDAAEDSPVFATLYRRHVDQVFRYLLARVGDEQTAQDLTSETFVAALEGFDDYRGEGRFVSWLLGIARNKAADRFRRARDTVPLDEAPVLQDVGPSPETQTIERLRMEQVAEALEWLSADRAEALALRIFGGLSAAEAAEVLGKSKAAVKMLVHRGIRDLQARFAR